MQQPLLADIEVEGVLVDNAIEIRESDIIPFHLPNETQQIENPPEVPKKKERNATKCLAFTILLCILAGIVGVFIPLKVHAESSKSSDVILMIGNHTKLSTSSTAWNDWGCFQYEWKLSGSGNSAEHIGSNYLYTVTETEQFDTATVTCKNIFSYKLHSSAIDWSIAVYNEGVITMSDLTAITSCPMTNDITLSTGSFVVDTNSILMTSLKSGDILYSSTCNGFIVRILSRPNVFTGVVRYSNNVTLENVFSTLSTPPTELNLLPALSNNNERLSTTSAAIATTTDTSLLHRTDWLLPFSSTFFSGSLLFNSITWDVMPSIEQLKYANSKLDVITWYMSSTLSVDTEFTIQVASGSSVSDVVIPLYGETSPLSVIPLSVLEYITVSSTVNVSLHATVSASQLSQSYNATWRIAAILAFNWEIGCATEKGYLSCSGNVIQTNVTLTQPLTGMTDTDKPISQGSVSIDTDLLLSFDVRLDDISTLRDQIALSMDLETPTSTCPQMSVQIADNASSDVSLFTSDALSVFDYAVYTGDVLAVSTSNPCVPTKQPSIKPFITAKPSPRPTAAPSLRPVTKSPFQGFSFKPTDKPTNSQY